MQIKPYCLKLFQTTWLLEGQRATAYSWLMVANNVNHTKWAAGETLSCFPLEFEEWTLWVKTVLRWSWKLVISQLWTLALLVVVVKTNVPHMIFISNRFLCPNAPYIKQTKWIMWLGVRLSMQLDGDESYKNCAPSMWRAYPHLCYPAHPIREGVSVLNSFKWKRASSFNLHHI